MRCNLNCSEFDAGITLQGELTEKQLETFLLDGRGKVLTNASPQALAGTTRRERTALPTAHVTAASRRSTQL